MLRHCDQRSGGFTMTKSNLRLVSPHAVIGTVPPRRVPNAELRTREYLTEAEVERLIKAANANRNGAARRELSPTRFKDFWRN